ncbi:hypothetical protein A3I34_02070 [Candidatus Jorgensenbacteria bacterium RIFCSPLOWO2_02_FULL_45_12]|uniref:Uncharacterized protein n=1 Tax=Candidatus Jorgensenbacteria bacterium RIFCSPHIGHO2_02_FULL_45_20 TaxID=1798470 RepID=A0A1F6BP69_9BACT|nr:MAG: hypothetical protein A3D55_00060 [Candidatus Jorgensenbacteria bacterium RIFCSPHIGHO2_02_FULL_45_20]OGG42579.1 MAG: hypothetical protein A3I34_02070 [Candidatus Jorgensenbacteria bacterium RIFCSPLOWO2_02_FULL_45_12]
MRASIITNPSGPRTGGKFAKTGNLGKIISFSSLPAFSIWLLLSTSVSLSLLTFSSYVNVGYSTFRVCVFIFTLRTGTNSLLINLIIAKKNVDN